MLLKFCRALTLYVYIFVELIILNDMSLDKIGVALVTGGAGFIGSHLVEKLIANEVETKVVDNLTAGKLSNMAFCKESKKFSFKKIDLNDSNDFKNSLDNVKTVFHLAADPEVRTGFNHPEKSFRENIQSTFNLLEQIRKSDVERILFTSTSTVYGEPNVFPTPESYGPCIPISPYGASKLAGEALTSAYCHTYGINGLIFRLANIIGPRSNHGVILDFVNKLKVDNSCLEILGDGQQSKSYLHVEDCVNGMLNCLTKVNNKIEIFNVGNLDEIDVMSIAKIVCNRMNLENVELMTSGGVSDGRGWIGDVKKMNLGISKLIKTGWAPQLSSSKAVDLTVKELLRVQD